MRPDLIGWVAAAPHFVVVGEHAGFEDKVLGSKDHLLRRIRIFGGSRDVHGVIYFLNEDLHRLIHIVIGASACHCPQDSHPKFWHNQGKGAPESP